MHTVILTAGLFALTLLVPGPNLLYVIRSSLSGGRNSGVAAGLGVALGDALYAALGLAGAATVIERSGPGFQGLKILGGLFLLWIAWKLAKKRPEVAAARIEQPHRPLTGYFIQGLATDLANPQTILFFASIFAATLTTATPVWVKSLAWGGIVTVSAAWRVFLSIAFASGRARTVYSRHRRAFEWLAGAAMAAFALRLLADALQG